MIYDASHVILQTEPACGGESLVEEVTGLKVSNRGPCEHRLVVVDQRVDLGLERVKRALVLARLPRSHTDRV